MKDPWVSVNGKSHKEPHLWLVDLGFLFGLHQAPQAHNLLHRRCRKAALLYAAEREEATACVGTSVNGPDGPSK